MPLKRGEVVEQGERGRPGEAEMTDDWRGLTDRLGKRGKNRCVS